MLSVRQTTLLLRMSHCWRAWAQVASLPARVRVSLTLSLTLTLTLTLTPTLTLTLARSPPCRLGLGLA